MLKRLKRAGLIPALVVSAVLAAAMIVPASANLLVSVTPGCAGGYTYGAPTTPKVLHVVPDAGRASGGVGVSIFGAYFCIVTAVKFGTVAASIFTLNSRSTYT